ncbi:MAG: hypothetical protein AMXMBFR64_17560 [Myxococcales bacterium]
MAADRLSIGVELTIGSDVFAIPGGNVRACDLRLRLWGLDGSVTFVVHGEEAEDALLPRFVTPDRADVRLTLNGEFPLVDTQPEPLVVRALATSRAVREFAFADVSGTPVLTREYTVHFTDPAQVLWRQHFPAVLRAEATVADVVGEQAVGGLKLNIEMASAGVTHHVVCLPLDASRGTSFYDLLVDWVDGAGGHLLLDHDTGEYSLRDRKPGGTARTVRGTEVGRATLRLPATRRSKARVHNGAAEQPATVEVAQDQAVEGVTEDHLVITPLSVTLDDRVELETTRLRLRAPELSVVYSTWPSVPFAPGRPVSLAQEWLAGAAWPRGKAFRVLSVDLRAEATDPLESRDRDTTARTYTLDLASVWESAADLSTHLPPRAEPPEPLLVEGKVVCDGGQPGDRIYAVHEDPDTGEWFYEVLVPLWNQEVRAPFRPSVMRGHFYAPLTKDERVLVRLDLHGAEIVRTLQWTAGVQLPLETQGNRILFGKNAADETALEHVYVDDKPVWTVRRVRGADGETLQMEEGLLFMEVREDESATEEAPTVDLSPQVAAASAELETAASGSVGRISGAFASAKGELTGKLEDAKASVGGAVDALKGELGALAGAAKGDLQGAAAALTGHAAALASAATAAITELRTRTEL